MSKNHGDGAHKKIRAINFKHWENDPESELLVCIGSDASTKIAKEFLEEEYRLAWCQHSIGKVVLQRMDDTISDETLFASPLTLYDFAKNRRFEANPDWSKEDKLFFPLSYEIHIDDHKNYRPPVILSNAHLRAGNRTFLNMEQSKVRFLLAGSFPDELKNDLIELLLSHRIKKARIDIIEYASNNVYDEDRIMYSCGKTVENLTDTLKFRYKEFYGDEWSFDDDDALLPPRADKKEEILPMHAIFDWMEYPHPKYNKEGVVTGGVNHIDNLKYILFRYGVTLRYNVISKKDELILNDGVVRLLDNSKAECVEIVKSLCELNSYPITRIEHQILAISNSNPYNPIIEYCTHRPWDGVDRISSILATVSVDDDLKEWRDIVVAKFMIAAVCAAINDEQKRYTFKTVLTFQGEQGLGKTPWIKILTGGMVEYFLEGHILNPGEKDSCITALRHWITELGELDATTKKSDVAMQKAFINRGKDLIRLPYARTDSEWVRRTVFFGTVNPSSFLVDNTGNDRYWCLPVNDLALDELELIDMQQAWAQIYEFAITQIGNNIREPWKLTDEEHNFQRNINERFRALTHVEEAIIDKFEPIKDKPVQYQANISDILSAVGLPYATDKERASAKVWIEKFFGRESKYNGKRGWAIPAIPGLNDADHRFHKMKKRG